jgi:hypothetical protein
LQFSPQAFYKQNTEINEGFNDRYIFPRNEGREAMAQALAEDGLIFSRDEYGAFKSQAKRLSGVNFLNAAENQPNPQDSPEVEALKQAPRAVSRAAKGSVETGETSSLRRNEEEKKQTLG